MLGLERWLRGQEHWLLLQRTGVQFPVPTGQLTPICHSSSSGLAPSDRRAGRPSTQRQNLVCYLRNPHYGSLIYADGHGEVWTDWK
ncbi:RIKEN cDNA 1110032A03, isoform CRA_a [Mus musculus]|nr:RIKEN cDNA 1110032A03, isoform CRA_a [Mus musculus]